MSPTTSTVRGSANAYQSAVEASPEMKEEPNELSSTEKRALEDFRAASSEHFVP